MYREGEGRLYTGYSSASLSSERMKELWVVCVVYISNGYATIKNTANRLVTFTCMRHASGVLKREAAQLNYRLLRLEGLLAGNLSRSLKSLLGFFCFCFDVWLPV